MIKKYFFLLILLVTSIVFLKNSSSVSAAEIAPNLQCEQNIDVCGDDVEGRHYDCMPDPSSTSKTGFLCTLPTVGNTFGTIQAPGPLAGFLKTDPTGAGAISKFLSNFVVLIYTAAAIVLIFMLLWGAFDWMVSGGDKEKLSSAQKRIINAFIGILLFAVAFAVLQVLGQFTGFKFFVSKPSYTVPMDCLSACGRADDPTKPDDCNICSNGDVLCGQPASNCPK